MYVETGESCCLKWSFSLTLCEIPWRFSSILLNVKISLTLCKIPWQFPDLEKFYFSLTFPWRLWTLIDENLTFDIHIDSICLKASRQISALQRLTGLLDFPSRKAIYNSFISSHFNYCPLVWFFTSKASIAKMQKLQERALRFVLKDSVSDYETLLAKSGVDSFRIATIKIMAIEIYKILNDMGPD